MSISSSLNPFEIPYVYWPSSYLVLYFFLGTFSLPLKFQFSILLIRGASLLANMASPALGQ